jgi:aqualysin 1
MVLLCARPNRQLEGLRRNPNVVYIEVDQTVTIDVTWGLDRIDQRNLPLNNVYSPNGSGSGVHAYIIDTGIRSTHSEFSGRVGNGYDVIDGGAPDDCNGHGTHVAGTVGGATYGVANAVTLHGVRVLNCSGSGSTSGVIAGVNWVTSNRQLPAVANMSLGGSASTSLDSAVNNSINAGVTYAVAGGNSNANACNYSPARVAAALTVGATTSTDARSSFSNYGTCVNIFAPGSSITSAWHTSNTATNTISGTSMASPHVAGAATLYLGNNPSASPSAVFNARDSTMRRPACSPASAPARPTACSTWAAAVRRPRRRRRLRPPLPRLQAARPAPAASFIPAPSAVAATMTGIPTAPTTTAQPARARAGW